eukprot:5851214-Amphidinium_carterae.1
MPIQLSGVVERRILFSWFNSSFCEEVEVFVAAEIAAPQELSFDSNYRRNSILLRLATSATTALGLIESILLRLPLGGWQKVWKQYQ